MEKVDKILYLVFSVMLFIAVLCLTALICGWFDFVIILLFIMLGIVFLMILVFIFMNFKP